jgi:hypothetical protein
MYKIYMTGWFEWLVCLLGEQHETRYNGPNGSCTVSALKWTYHTLVAPIYY